MKKSSRARGGNGSAILPLRDAPATIGFRLDEASRQMLALQAARLDVSPHDLARHYVIEMLSSAQERAALWNALRELDERLHDLREDLVLVAEGILVASESMSLKDAQDWVDANFP